MDRRSIAVSALLLILLPTSAAAADWPGFRGSDGTGRVVAGLPGGEGFLDFELAWKHPLGSGYSGIAVAGDRLVTAATDGDQDFLVALDAASGEALWRRDLAKRYVGHDGSHDGPIATPAIADGRVFMVGAHGELVALDLATGSELWSLHLVDDLEREAPFYGFGSSPLVMDGTLIVQVGGDSGSVIGLDPATGDRRWQAFDEAGSLGSPSPIAAELDGRRQVVVVSTAKLAGLDPSDGTQLWELALEAPFDPMGVMTQSPLPIDGSRLFLKHRDGETFIVTVAEGEQGWSAEATLHGNGLSRSYSPPTTGSAALYGYTARFLSAVDPASGEVLWRSREPGDGFLVNVGGQLAVLAKTGSLHLGAASTDGWQEAARLQVFDDLAWTPPSFAGGSLYVRSLGEIARVDLVRRDRMRTAAVGVEPPRALAALAGEVAGGSDARTSVDAFLDGRELPWIEGDRAVFLWRGEAQDVAVAGEMIGMRREEPMHRLDGTDLWWWATDFDPRARASYVFFVDYEPTIDPTHDRTTPSTVLGADMNWNRGEPMPMSWVAGSEWPGREAVSTPAPGAGAMSEIEVSVQPPTPEGAEAAPEPVVVPAHVWLPPGYEDSDARYPVVYVHHPAAREAGAWQAALDSVVGRTAEPLIAVLLEAPRMRGFGGLFASQFVPEIDRRYRTRAAREGRANVGMGWQGFGAAMTTLANAEVFGAVGIQSLYMLEGQKSALAGALTGFDAQATPMRAYLEWGRWDLISPHEAMNFRQSARDGWQMLSAAGVAMVGGEVWDSTDFGSWRNRTGVLLESLFPLAGSEGSLASWLTAP